MFNRIELNSTSVDGRLLARQLARELTKDEFHLIAGGRGGGGATATAAGSSTVGNDIDHYPDASDPAVGL